MPKPPITLLIVRSKYQSCVHAALVIGLCLLAAWLLPLWVAIGGTLSMGVMVWRQYQSQPVGALQLNKTGHQFLGRWVLENGELGENQSVRCDYIGPWLLGLYIGPRRLWLWPDSLPPHSQRALRRLCHRPGH